MRVIVGERAGFCRGVKNALELTLEAIQKRQDGESICTFGPLIHNRQVLAMLEDRGVQVCNEIEQCVDKKVVIRAHGIPPEQRQALHKAGADLLNATCKRVARVQGLIKRYTRRGYHTVIVGDDDHAEVIGLMGYTDGQGIVISRPEEVGDLPKDWEHVLLAAQTTQNQEVFNVICKRFLERYPEGVVVNTICDSTQQRQAEVRQLCSQVEAMVIVGGYHSGNTLRLAEVARECGIPSYHVETEAGLDREKMARYRTIGVSAGASTPKWMIRNVVRFLESIEPEAATERKLKWMRLLELLASANVYVALGSALLTFLVAAMTGLAGSFAKSFMAACYVFAMHTLNRYLDRDAVQLNDPERAVFYRRWATVFTGTSIAAAACSLWIAMGFGAATFLAMLVLVLSGVLYAVPISPRISRGGLSVLKIKDIPASKTFLIPLAWATSIAVFPNLSHLFEAFGKILFAFWIVFLLVLVRTALFDLLAVQGDRIVGKETIVVSLGESNTTRFLMVVLGLLAGSLLLGIFTGLSSPFAWLIYPATGAYAWYLRTYLKNGLKGGALFETFIESVLMATGVLALLWLVIAS